MSTAERFTKKVTVDPESGCWLWTARRNRKGYGEFRFSDGTTQLAHRVAWFVAFGELPTLCVLHRCDTPACVNPAHLFLGTKGDNNRDMYLKNRGFRGQAAPRGERNGSAKLSAATVRAIRTSKLSSRKVAALIGITPSTVTQIRRRETWSHVEEA